MSCAIFELLHFEHQLDAQLGNSAQTVWITGSYSWTANAARLVSASPGWRFDKGPGHPIT